VIHVRRRNVVPADLAAHRRRCPRGPVPVGLALVAALAAPLPVAGSRGQPAALAPVAPWAASAEAGLSVGLLPAHSVLTIAFGRRVLDRIEIDAELRLGVGGAISMVEPGVHVNVLLASAEGWNLGLGWSARYSRMTIDAAGLSVPVNALVVGPRLALGVALGSKIELRITPLGVLGYWSGMWGMNAELGAGAAVRF
jgi:hypothetical protein